MADPKQTEHSQAPTEVPVKKTDIRDKERGAKAEESNRTAGACCADQIRQVGQTGVFT